MSDNVNHPKHYEGATSIECIEAMIVAFGKQAVYDFCKCNAFKYVWRYQNKNGKEDLEKAAWYINKCEDLVVKKYPEKFFCNGQDNDEQLEELKRLIRTKSLTLTLGGDDKVGYDKEV